MIFPGKLAFFQAYADNTMKCYSSQYFMLLENVKITAISHFMTCFASMPIYMIYGFILLIYLCFLY